MKNRDTTSSTPRCESLSDASAMGTNRQMCDNITAHGQDSPTRAAPHLKKNRERDWERASLLLPAMRVSPVDGEGRQHRMRRHGYAGLGFPSSCHGEARQGLGLLFYDDIYMLFKYIFHNF